MLAISAGRLEEQLGPNCAQIASNGCHLSDGPIATRRALVLSLEYFALGIHSAHKDRHLFKNILTSFLAINYRFHSSFLCSMRIEISSFKKRDALFALFRLSLFRGSLGTILSVLLLPYLRPCPGADTSCTIGDSS